MKNILQFISSKKVLIATLIIVLAVLYILLTNKDTSDTNASNASEKYFTCITVEEGDSLWSIAEEYMTEEYESHQEYISEVKQINNLTSSTIVTGTNLLVPYYEVRNYQ